MKGGVVQMTLQRWDPFRDVMTLRDAVDRLFEESFVNPDRLFSLIGRGSRPMPLEVYETGDELVVRALVPGVTEDNLDVQYQQGMLTIRAKTETPAAHDDWTWHLREIGYGEMTRTLTLPREIDVDHAQASFKDGILTLHLPKAPEARPKQIKVSSAAQIGAGSKS